MSLGLRLGGRVALPVLLLFICTGVTAKVYTHAARCLQIWASRAKYRLQIASLAEKFGTAVHREQ